MKTIIKVIDEGLKKYPVQTLTKDEDGNPVDPGLCPMFLFLPTKLQIAKMIIRASIESSKPI